MGTQLLEPLPVDLRCGFQLLLHIIINNVTTQTLPAQAHGGTFSQSQAYLLEKAQAQGLRLFLVSEPGPTKFVFKDSSGKKFKVNVGSDLSCSCGGGSHEQC